MPSRRPLRNNSPTSASGGGGDGTPESSLKFTTSFVGGMQKVSHAFKDSFLATLSDRSNNMGTLRSRPPAEVQIEARPESELFQHQRSGLTDLQGFLQATQSCADMVLQAAILLERAPQQMLKQVQHLPSHANGEKGHLQDLSPLLEAVSKQIAGAVTHVNNLQKLVAKTHRLATTASTTLARRDEAWLRKVHYGEKVEVLMGASKSDNSRCDERLKRNQAKLRESEEAYNAVALEASKAVDEIVDRRVAFTAGMLSHLCAFYSAVFQDSHHLAGSFRAMVGQLKANHLQDLALDDDRKRSADGTLLADPLSKTLLVAAGNNVQSSPPLLLPHRRSVQSGIAGVTTLDGDRASQLSMYTCAASEASTTSPVDVIYRPASRSSSLHTGQSPPTYLGSARLAASEHPGGIHSQATHRMGSIDSRARVQTVAREDSVGSTGSWLRQNRG